MCHFDRRDGAFCRPGVEKSLFDFAFQIDWTIRDNLSNRYRPVSGTRTRIASSTRTINSENFCLPTLRIA